MPNSGKNTQKLSIGTFDILKGILLISVIVYHNWWGSYLTLRPGRISGAVDAAVKYFLISTMPCLLMISGLGFRSRSVGKVFVQQKRTLRAYAITALCTIAALFLLDLIFYPESFGPDAAYILKSGIPGILLGLFPSVRPFVLFGETLGSCGPSWFILVLFESSMLLAVLFTMTKKLGKNREIWEFALLFAVAVIGCEIESFHKLPFSLEKTMEYAISFYIGVQLKKNRACLMLSGKKRALLFAAAIAAGLALYPLLFPKLIHYMDNADLSDIRLIRRLVGFAAAILLSNALGFCMMQLGMLLNRVSCKLFDVFGYIGQNAIIFFCVHSVDYLAFPWELVGNVLPFESHWVTWLLTFVRVVLTLGITWLIRDGRLFFGRLFSPSGTQKG